MKVEEGVHVADWQKIGTCGAARCWRLRAACPRASLVHLLRELVDRKAVQLDSGLLEGHATNETARSGSH